MQCKGTCLVSSCLQWSHGNFEDAFYGFLQYFAKLLDVYHHVVSDSISCILICLCQGRQQNICIRPRHSRWPLSECPENSPGIFRLYQFLPCTVNSRVPKTVRHWTYLNRICPKLSIDSSPSRLGSQTSVRRPTVKLFGSSPIWLESQASFRRPMLKLFGSSPSQLESQASVHRPSLKLFCSSPSRLSLDWRRNYWLTSQPYILWPPQPLTTHVLDFCYPTVTETKMLPIVCTTQN